jgi:hypothetical protein
MVAIGVDHNAELSLIDPEHADLNAGALSQPTGLEGRGSREPRC